jgi:TPP-dependent pyruvate/acetoin dehydrogenase alpha subunit
METARSDRHLKVRLREKQWLSDEDLGGIEAEVKAELDDAVAVRRSQCVGAS